MAEYIRRPKFANSQTGKGWGKRNKIKTGRGFAIEKANTHIQDSKNLKHLHLHPRCRSMS
jgi:hypothetical protein